MSKEIISKELLGLVLGEDFEILSITEHFVRIRHLEAYTSVKWCGYKVAQECKEWLLKYEYTLAINHHLDCTAVTIIDNGKGIYSTPPMTAYTELEAVIKATEWVAKEKGLL